MATTNREHRQVQLQILDLVYDERLKHLEAQKLLAEKNNDLREANRIQAQIDHLPSEKADETAAVKRQTMDPLQAWMHQVPHTAAEITEALQSVEARGLDSLSGAIADVITGTKSLGAAFKDISREIIGDIIQMTVKMLIFRAISAAFGGGGGGISGATDFSGSFGAVSGVPHFAGGGSFTVGGRGGIDSNLLSINGQPRAMVDRTETVAVLPKNLAANNNRPGPIEIVIHSAPSDDAWARVEAISVNTTAKAAPVIVKAAVNNTMRIATRKTLNGGG
jgi:hypothetical protein